MSGALNEPEGPAFGALDADRPSTLARRRTVTRGLAWSAPALLVAASAPAYAASCPATTTIVTTGLAGNGVDLNLRDNKNQNNNTNISPSNARVVNLSLRVTCGGVPVSGVSITVAGDSTKDGEGNFMIGFSPASQTSGFTESPIQRTVTVLTDGSGQVRVKVSTAAYSADDCGAIPRSGTWSVSVSLGGSSPTVFTYLIYDGTAVVTC